MPKYNIPPDEIVKCQEMLDKIAPGVKVKTYADRYVVDVRGQRFGNLVAIAPTTKRKEGTRSTYWLCECDCGNMHVTRLDSLRDGSAESCGCHQRNWNKLRGGVAAFKRLYSRYRGDAKKRNLPFMLTRNNFLMLTSSPCWYCGKPPSQSIKESNAPNLSSDYLYNGIDRIDNNEGYVMGNVRPCCKACNWLKRDFAEKEFFTQVKRVYEHLQLGETMEANHGESINSDVVVTGRFCGTDWDRPYALQSGHLYLASVNPLQ